MSNSLQPHGLQHTRLPGPSPTPRACSNSVSLELVMPSNDLILCHPFLLLSSVFPSSLFHWVHSLHQVATGLAFQLQYQSFQWIFRTVSFRRTGWISLESKGLSRVFSNTTVQKLQFFSAHLYGPTLAPYRTTRKTIALTRQTFVGKVSAFKYALSSLKQTTIPTSMPIY